MMDDSELRTALETHHNESYGWALSCCTRSSLEAEAILQTVYLKVLAGQARYEGKAPFKTWLFAVIRQTAADERRRQWLRRVLLEARPAPLAAATVERPDEAFDRAELRRLLRDVLAQLPPRQREVLQLVFYHDLSLAEAALVMGVALGTARTHYERGKQRFRARMEELQIHDETGDETGTGRTAPQRIVSATEAGR